MAYHFVVGLEVHAELATRTKMFCGCKNDPDEKIPNTNICPVCTAHPGALPVPNKKAIEHVIKVGLALGGKIADFTEFDRKNYFYPDIPKGYQISQYKYPIVTGGHLRGFDITRVHLEEDTGTNKHEKDFSLVDFNRAGVPLMELVTEPHVFGSAEEAAKAAAVFSKEFQLVLWYLGASEANMEKGEMRVEANISVSPEKKKFGTKVEVKNLNSFRSVERAIKFELDRMLELYKERKESEIVQETRGWDEEKQKTYSQRRKESSHDYRYFPDPDLPKMHLHEAFDLKKMEKELPELPEEKRKRYGRDYGTKNEDVEVYVENPSLAVWFEAIAQILRDKRKVKLASNYITTDYLGLDKRGAIRAENFAELINLTAENKISSRVAKDILAKMVTDSDISPSEIAEKEGLLQKSDEGELTQIAEKIIMANQKVAEDYKKGKEAALMSLVGAMMRETKGSANPQVAKQILVKLLE
ncbi:MAG: Asp-tRNA(Asn)/Glu-tRNA(Gln) amidotransferase subunit GatB [Patescibacteria group bacterium]